MNNLKCKTWFGLKHFPFLLSGKKKKKSMIYFIYLNKILCNPKAAEKILLNPNTLSCMESYVIKVNVTGINESIKTEFYNRT